MDHAINITHDGILKIRIPEGFQINKVQVEEIGTEKRQLFEPTPPNTSNTLDSLDLISRQDTIETVNETIAQYIPYLIRETNGIPLEVALAIKRLPSAQKTGKWEIQGNRGICSQCHKYTYLGYEYDFCPNCGADMREGEQE